MFTAEIAETAENSVFSAFLSGEASRILVGDSEDDGGLIGNHPHGLCGGVQAVLPLRVLDASRVSRDGEPAGPLNSCPLATPSTLCMFMEPGPLAF